MYQALDLLAIASKTSYHIPRFHRISRYAAERASMDEISIIHDGGVG